MSKEDAHRGSECGSEARRDFGPVVWRQRCSASARGQPGRSTECGSFLPPSSTSGAHGPARSQQAGLVADFELVVFSFGFAFMSVSPPRPA